MIGKRILRSFLAVLAGVSICLLIVSSNSAFRSYRTLNSAVLPNGLIAGGDFLAFYCAGKLFSESREKLYDYAAQEECEKQIVGKGPSRWTFLAFVYPPLIAAGFSLLSDFSYMTALTLWCVLSLILVVVSLILLLRRSSLPLMEQGLLFFSLLCFAPFLIECLHGGQLSALGLAMLTGVYLMLRHEKDFLAGSLFALSYYKPPLFLLLLLFLIMEKRARFTLGFLLTAAFLILASISLVGVSGLEQYLERSASFIYGSRHFSRQVFMPVKPAGVHGFLVMLIPNSVNLARALYLLITFAIVVLAYRSELLGKPRPGALTPLHFAVQVTISLCLSSYVLVYDLTLLALPIIIVYSDIYRNGLSKQALFVMASILLLFLEFTFRDTTIGTIRLNAAAPAHFLFLIAVIYYASKRFAPSLQIPRGRILPRGITLRDRCSSN